MPRITLRFRDDEYDKLKGLAQVDPFKGSIGKYVKHRSLHKNDSSSRIKCMELIRSFESLINDFDNIDLEEKTNIKADVLEIKNRLIEYQNQLNNYIL